MDLSGIARGSTLVECMAISEMEAGLWGMVDAWNYSLVSVGWIAARDCSVRIGRIRVGWMFYWGDGCSCW